jgi:hypothetical protein
MPKHNSKTPEYLYHITQEDVSDQPFTWVPKKVGSHRCYLEPKTPRICFSKNISGCFITLGECLKSNKDISILKTIKPVHYYTPTSKEVLDVDVTEEVWRLSPVKLQKVAILKAENLHSNDINIFDYLNYNAGEKANLNWQKTAKNIVKNFISPFNLQEQL